MVIDMSESRTSVQVHQARNEAALTGFCNLAQYLSKLLIDLRPKEGSIREKTSYHQLLTQLYDKEVISTSTLLTEMGLDYDEEVARLRKVKLYAR